MASPWDKVKDPKAREPYELRHIYEDTIFCPVWCGYNVGDSYRWAEVMESGCIPMPDQWVYDYYVRYFNISNFRLSEKIPRVKTGTVKEVMGEWLNLTNATLDTRWSHIQQWWKDYKEQLKIEVGNHLRPYCGNQIDNNITAMFSQVMNPTLKLEIAGS